MTEQTQPATQNTQEVSQSAAEKAETLQLTPAADVYENKDGAVIYLDLPGVNRDNLTIDVDDHVLSIQGNMNLQTPETLNPTYMDVHSGVFSRRFTLSEELDSANIEAILKDGELKLSIPRSEKHKPRKIEVKVV